MSVSILAGSHKALFGLNFVAMAEVLASANTQVHCTFPSVSVNISLSQASH